MKKRSKSKSPLGPRVDPYLEGLMGKLLDRLVGLEKKMDTLINQSKSAQSPEAHQPPRRERLLYEAICADCHCVCEVPFKPSEDRPVYCKKCFADRKSGGPAKPFPILTPVAMPSKPVAKPSAPEPPPTRINKAKKKKKKA
jgi:CxxC-x17-CxxC domain-containing protein